MAVSFSFRFFVSNLISISAPTDLQYRKSTRLTSLQSHAAGRMQRAADLSAADSYTWAENSNAPPFVADIITL